MEGLHEGLEKKAGEVDLLALPAVVLRPAPAVDTSSYLASALGQGGIPSQVRLAGPTEELVDLALNGYPALDWSTVTADEEFVCTPLGGPDEMPRTAAVQLIDRVTAVFQPAGGMERVWQPETSWSLTSPPEGSTNCIRLSCPQHLPMLSLRKFYVVNQIYSA